MIVTHARVIVTKEIREERAIPGDTRKLCEHYMKWQERHRDRLVRPTDGPPDNGS